MNMPEPMDFDDSDFLVVEYSDTGGIFATYSAIDRHEAKEIVVRETNSNRGHSRYGSHTFKVFRRVVAPTVVEVPFSFGGFSWDD